jgi:hypothetical protein
MNEPASPVLDFENNPDDALLLRVDLFDGDPLSLAASVDALEVHRFSKAQASVSRPPLSQLAEKVGKHYLAPGRREPQAAASNALTAPPSAELIDRAQIFVPTPPRAAARRGDGIPASSASSPLPVGEGENAINPTGEVTT